MSAILKKIDRTWLSSKLTKIFAVFSENACTSLQITFLTNLTGIIIIIIDPQSSRTLQKMMSYFLKKFPNFKTILAGSKPMVLHCRLVALWKQYAWMKLRFRFNVWGHQYGYVEERSCRQYEYVEVLRSPTFPSTLPAGHATWLWAQDGTSVCFSGNEMSVVRLAGSVLDLRQRLIRTRLGRPATRQWSEKPSSPERVRR